jgi:hypothetical protein
VRIAGKVSGFGNPAPVIGDATVSLVSRTGGNLGTGKSGTDGTFDVSAPSSTGKPVDAFIRVSAASRADTEVYPPTPWVADGRNLNIVVLKAGEIGLVYASAKPAAVQRKAGNGTVTIAVQDCDQKPVAGATVSVTANGKAVGTVAYIDGKDISTSATATGEAGVAIIFNVPPGSIEVAATTDDKQKLRAHTIDARADVATATSVLP